MTDFLRKRGMLLSATLTSGGIVTSRLVVPPDGAKRMLIFVNVAGSCKVEVLRKSADGDLKLRDERTASTGVEEYIVIEPPYPLVVRLTDLSLASNVVSAEVI